VVILEAGYPHRADILDQAALGSVSEKVAVLPGVAAFTRACAYDRPGTILTDPDDPARHSRSDPVPQSRTAANLVTDIRDLLHAADIPGPYVLVGHSLGGIVGRLYVATFPAEVAGLVLVDSSHEGQSERFQTVMTSDQWAVLDRMATHLPGLDTYPDMERIDLDASFAQLREGRGGPSTGRNSPGCGLPWPWLQRGRDPGRDFGRGDGGCLAGLAGRIGHADAHRATDRRHGERALRSA
jgi:pimeloyl-ACP methyl ester carboxylesterase